MSCSTCTQYWYPCSQNSLFPQLSCQEFWMSRGDDLGRTSEMGWRETGFLFDSGFSGGENCCPGRRSCAESQLHPSAHLPPMYRWERAECREQQLCLAHKSLTNGDAKNHTQQQCGITQTFWENRSFKAIHAPLQRDIQNVAELSFWKHFWQVYFLLIWREGFPSDCFECKYYSHKTHQTIYKLWPLVKLAIFLRPLSTRCNQ